jgi:hypothetical protein
MTRRGVKPELPCPACDGTGSMAGTATLFGVAADEPCSVCAGRKTVAVSPALADLGGGPVACAFGGGVQSTGNLVLAGRGLLAVKTFLFANVGDDSEDPGTLIYVREIAKPYADAHGLDLIELVRVRRDQRVETLYHELMKPGSKRLPIPIRMDNGAPGNRSCTAEFKIKVMGRWLRAHGASATNRATVAVGISLEEIHRVNARKAQYYERIWYPLVGILDGDPVEPVTGRALKRDDCERIITSEPLPGGPHGELATRLRLIVETVPACGDTQPHPAHAEDDPALAGLGRTASSGTAVPWYARQSFGKCLGRFAAVTTHDLVASGYTRMPRPPKSACWFCPFHRPSTWQTMRREEPAQFFAAADLEATLNRRRDELGKDHVWLTRFAGPLAKVIPPAEILPMSDEDDGASCDNGWCMT